MTGFLGSIGRLFGRHSAPAPPVLPPEPLFPRHQPPPPSEPAVIPQLSPYAVVAADLLELSNPGAVEAVVAAGLRRHPGDVRLLILRARAADKMGNFAAAAAHWMSVLDTAPENASAWLRAGTLLLRQLERLEEADAVLSDAALRFPDDRAIAVEHAWAAVVRKDQEEAIRRYRRAYELDTDNLSLIASAAGGLRDLGRHDEADALLLPELHRAGQHEAFLVTFAWIAHYRADWPEALRRWQVLAASFPSNPSAPWLIGNILGQQLQRLDEAEHVLGLAVQTHPHDLQIAMEYAKLPALAGRWDESLRRWFDLAVRHPGNATIVASRGYAQLQVDIQAMDAAAGSGNAESGERPQEPAVARTTRVDMIRRASAGVDQRELMLRFESLGLNCEFGLVQRHFGAEPLGLFRWNAIHPAGLADGLEQRFEGIGEPDNLTLGTLDGEYIVTDRRYATAMHTFLSEKDTTVGVDRLRAQFGRRMRFLRDKLLEDLRGGEKIFVYQYRRPLTEDEMARIHASIRAYGPGTIMFVDDMSPHRSAGQVQETQPGRLEARIDRLIRTEGWNNISTEGWLDICLKAAALRPPPG